MEVTTMSPSPASPTEGEDLCETDVTSVAMHIVTLLICLCGLAGNGAVIGLVNLKSPNYGFFVLAVIDFLFLLFTVPSALLFLLAELSCSPIVPLMYLSFLPQLSVVSLYWGLFRLMRSSDVWYMDKLWKLCCHRELPLRLLWVAEGVEYWAFITVFTVSTVTFRCPSHEQELCRAALISIHTIILLLLAAPLVISSTVDFINAKWGSQQQQPKKRNIVTFIIALFTLILSLWNFLQQLGYIAVSSQFFSLLTCINSSIKPFIYFLVGRCWRPGSMGSLRLSLQRVFEEQKRRPVWISDPIRETGV